MTGQDQNRYIPILELVTSLADSDGQLASFFIQDNVHVATLMYIEKSIKNYLLNVRTSRGNTHYASLVSELSKGDS